MLPEAETFDLSFIFLLPGLMNCCPCRNSLARCVQNFDVRGKMWETGKEINSVVPVWKTESSRNLDRKKERKSERERETEWGPIHTECQCSNLQIFPLMLLPSSVEAPIRNSGFHLFAFTPARSVWIRSEVLYPCWWWGSAWRWWWRTPCRGCRPEVWTWTTHGRSGCWSDVLRLCASSSAVCSAAWTSPSRRSRLQIDKKKTTHGMHSDWCWWPTHALSRNRKQAFSWQMTGDATCTKTCTFCAVQCCTYCWRNKKKRLFMNVILQSKSGFTASSWTWMLVWGPGLTAHQRCSESRISWSFCRRRCRRWVAPGGCCRRARRAALLAPPASSENS